MKAKTTVFLSGTQGGAYSAHLEGTMSAGGGRESITVGHSTILDQSS